MSLKENTLFYRPDPVFTYFVLTKSILLEEYEILAKSVDSF